MSHTRGLRGRDQDAQWDDRSLRPFFSYTAHTFAAQVDPGFTGEDGRQLATTPLGIEGAVLQRVLIDEAIEVLFQCARDFRWSSRARAIDQALDPLAGKPMDPFAERGIGKGERVRDGLQTLSFHDVAHGLGPAKDAGFFGLLEEGI